MGGLVAAASAGAATGRGSWPERHHGLDAVFAGVGLRIGEVIALRVATSRPGTAPPACGSTAKVAESASYPCGPRRSKRSTPTSVSHGAIPAPLARRPGCASAATARASREAPSTAWFRAAGIAPPPGSLAHAFRHTYANSSPTPGPPWCKRLRPPRTFSTTEVYPGRTGAGLEQTAMPIRLGRFLGAPPFPRGPAELVPATDEVQTHVSSPALLDDTEGGEPAGRPVVPAQRERAERTGNSAGATLAGCSRERVRTWRGAGSACRRDGSRGGR
jgi:hypothetical protein